MNIQDIIMTVKEVGIPSAVLFYILIVGSKNQRDMTATMAGIQKELMNLTCIIHDALSHLKK